MGISNVRTQLLYLFFDRWCFKPKSWNWNKFALPFYFVCTLFYGIFIDRIFLSPCLKHPWANIFFPLQGWLDALVTSRSLKNTVVRLVHRVGSFPQLNDCLKLLSGLRAVVHDTEWRYFGGDLWEETVSRFMTPLLLFRTTMRTKVLGDDLYI